MSDAGANVHFRLVERPGGASESGLFGHGNRRGGLCGSGAGVNAGRNARTIRDGDSLDACAGLGDPRVGRRIRAALFAGRAAMARVGRRRPPDVFAGPQFRLLALRRLQREWRIRGC